MKLWLSDILVKAVRYYEQQVGAKYHIGVIDAQNTLGEVLADGETQEFLKRKLERYLSDDPQQSAAAPILKEGAYK
jgi:hypothetical protein